VKRERGGGPGAGGERGDTVLRPMTMDDVTAVAVLEQALFGVEAWSPALLAAEMTADPGSRYYLVADDAGVIAGYGGLLAQAGGQADVLTLAVAEDRWGQGIGSALLDGLLAEADRRGCTEIFLEVRVDNDRAQRLYRRRGFTDVGIRRGYYQPSNTDALVMRLVPAAANRRPRTRGRHRTATTPDAGATRSPR
jgi:[ribosomal protein S18]-alanine N-acetyltransferase